MENFLRVMTGRHAPGVPSNKRLLSDDSRCENLQRRMENVAHLMWYLCSNVLIYMSGHGGDRFLKVRGATIISMALHTEPAST